MKLKLFRANSVHVTIGMLLMCGCLLLSPGCRPPQNPDDSGGIPLITHQPQDAEVATNHETSLAVAIQREPDQTYRFAWFREVPVPACTNPAEIAGLNLELQTNRPGWDSEELHFPNAVPADEGYYLCVITHEGTPEAPAELVARTGPIYVKVYGSSSPPPAGTNIVSNPQPGTRNLSGTQPSPTKICDLTSFNCAYVFQKNDFGLPFTSPSTPSTCEILVNTIDLSGIHHPLGPSQYAIRGYPLGPRGVPIGTNICATSTALGREFSAPVNTTYWLQLFLVDAPTAGATYQIEVSFP